MPARAPAPCLATASTWRSAAPSLTSLRSIVVCRTLLGRPLIVQEPGDYVDEAIKTGYDSILGDRESKVGTYKEFVLFDEAQVLPEYSIIYKRQYDPAAVPEHLRTRTVGTTGRCWLVRLDKGWAALPPNVNYRLLEAAKLGKTLLKMRLGLTDYVFDLERRTQTNLKTHKVREMKPPKKY
mmetsp:Transcript_42648/g.133090  ORF Transcript_42648/g.133090 Transcript_42648/m.133090 type:complete len:181 (-) Transcript_42648:60-602(-)